MQSFWRRLRLRTRTLRGMSWSDRSLALESLAMLAAARILVKCGSEKNLVARVGGTHGDATRIRPEELSSSAPPPASGPLAGDAVRVGAMIEHVARMTWWRSMCLEKAVAGRWMLRRRGIPSTMYVGMAKQGNGFAAHAWLVGEGHTLTGSGKTVYATLAAFREPAGSAHHS